MLTGVCGRCRCMIGLGGKERGLGESAKSKITSNIKNTVTDVRNLIGRRSVPRPKLFLGRRRRHGEENWAPTPHSTRAVGLFRAGIHGIFS